MNPFILFVLFVIGFYVLAAILEFMNISLLDFLFDFFQGNTAKKPTLRMIGRVALLLVVMGFFMPIGCDQTGFELAEHAMNIDKSIAEYGLNVDKSISVESGFGVWLYVLFFVSLIGGLLIIPLVMKRKIHIGLDWVSLIIPIVCVIVLLTKLTNITGDKISDIRLQIGGNVIIIGLIISLLAAFFASIIPEKDREG